MQVLRMLLEVTIYSSILFLVILLFRTVFKKHASPAMLYAAWLLLVLRLVIPVTVSGLSLIVLPAQEAAVQPPQSGLSALPEGAAGEASISPRTPAASAKAPDAAGSAVIQAGPAAEGTSAAATPAAPWEWDWGTALITLWIAGAAVVLFNMAVAKATLNRRLASAARLPDEWRQAALRIQNELGIRRRIRFAAMRDFDSPALCASLRPTIIIPMELLWQNSQSIEFALRHELTHLKRGDHLVCLLMMLLKAIYWFNPAVWLGARLMKMDMETACDSRVVSAMDGSEKKQYASTVLGMYTQAQQHFVLGMALGHTRRTAERRVRGIFMRRRSARGVKAAALLLAAIMLVACFTTALQPVRAAAPESITPLQESPAPEPTTTAAKTEAAASDFEYRDYGGYIVITGLKSHGVEIVIPSSINGKSVRGIANYLFNQFTDTISITIPGSVEFIEEDAFVGAFTLREINVDPANAHFKSQDGVLYDHDMTKLIVYPKKVDTSYIVPDSVTSINEYAFDFNQSLNSITLPDNIAADSITGTMFYRCISLTEINAKASSLNYESQDGILYEKGKTTLVRCPAGVTGALIIPDGVAAIGESAFKCCEELTSVTLPGSVRYIGSRAFDFCRNLKSVNIPDGITEIQRRSFNDCQKLADIFIPDSVTSIDEGAFAGSGLKSVTIPGSVTVIESGAFQNCTDLAEVNFEGRMPEFGYDVFKNTPDSRAQYAGIVEVTEIKWYNKYYHVEVDLSVPEDYTEDMAIDVLKTVYLIDSSGKKYKSGSVCVREKPDKGYFIVYQLPKGAALGGFKIEFTVPYGLVIQKDVDDSLIVQ